jgi:hypothetical protein
MNTTSRSGRRWAYAGAILGGTMSTAANVAHSYVPPGGVTGPWHPMAGAVISAVFWPVALFVAAEILARMRWPDGWRWLLVRLLGLLPVALVAALVSYRHMAGLLRYYREDSLTATLGPLAVDGLMTMATAALMASARHQPADPTTDLSAPTTVPRPVHVEAARTEPATRLRLPATMRAAIEARARQAAEEGRELTAADVRAAVRVPEDMAAQIVRELQTNVASTG